MKSPRHISGVIWDPTYTWNPSGPCLIGKDLVLGGWPSKIEVIWAPGNCFFLGPPSWDYRPRPMRCFICRRVGAAHLEELPGTRDPSGWRRGERARERSRWPHPKWWFSKGNPRLFQENLGWWNIIIWPDTWRIIPVTLPEANSKFAPETRPKRPKSFQISLPRFPFSGANC